jgi:hypothetical protein
LSWAAPLTPWIFEASICSTCQYRASNRAEQDDWGRRVEGELTDTKRTKINLNLRRNKEADDAAKDEPYDYDGARGPTIGG